MNERPKPYRFDHEGSKIPEIKNSVGFLKLVSFLVWIAFEPSTLRLGVAESTSDPSGSLIRGQKKFKYVTGIYLVFLFLKK